MADVTGILAANPPAQAPVNFLDTFGKIQNIKNQQATLANTQANTATTNQALNVARMNRQAQVSMGLYDLPDDQLAGGQPIRDALDAELRAGTIDQNTHDSYLASLPPSVDQNGNPTSADAFRQNIRSHIISTMTAPDAVRFAVGQPATVDYGSGIQPVMQGGALSQTPGSLTPVGAPYGKGLTPEGAATRIPGPNDAKTGQPTVVPVGGLPQPNPGAPTYVGAPPPLGGYTKTNLPPVAGVGGAQPPAQPGAVTQPPGAPPPANGGATPPALGGSTPATGANTPAVTSTPNPLQQPPAPTSGPIPGQMPTGNPPAFEDSRKMGQALTARAENYTTNKGNYQTLLTDLQNINTGPGTERQQHIAAFFQKYAGNPIIAGLTTEQLASGEGFNKVATQIALGQADSLGATDQTQRNTISATPNLSLSTSGNTQIIHKLLGNEDAISNKAQAWNAWSTKYGQGTYNDFSAWWNKNVDLRSFQVPYMDSGSDERRATLNFPRTNQGQNAAKEFLRRNDLVSAAQQNGWQTVIPQ